MTLRTRAWPAHRLLLGSMTGATLLSMALLVALVLGLSAPRWSRVGLLLQGLVLLGAAWVMHGKPHRAQRRWVWYPLLLGSAIYLWDATLPPPTLPPNLLRVLVPKLIIVGILSHMLLHARATHRPSGGVRVIGGYVDLLEVAALMGWPPTAIRARLQASPLALHVAGSKPIAPVRA